jgi:hypothetical protein
LTKNLELIAIETENQNLQCLRADILLSSLPGGENIVNLGGWQIYDPNSAKPNHIRGIQNADEILMPETGIYDSNIIDGKVVAKENAVIVKTNRAEDIQKWDTLAVAKNYVQTEGHVAVVIDKWLDVSGMAHLLIFDVNYAGDGQARIVEITDDNINSALGGLPRGERAKIFAVRSNIIQQKIASNRINNN